jgi:uncharacterized surface protein with fasciclin (FAS1) repeats
MEQKNSKSAIWAIVAVVVLIAGGFAIYAISQNNDDETAQDQAIQQVEETQAEITESEAVSDDIVALAIKTEALSTLVAAVQAAELVETLQGTGPYTVLAPTNAAFAALPDGTLESLLLPENKGDLAAILTYHVIAGKVLAQDLTNGQVVTTVNGGTLTVEINDEGLFFVDANGGRAQVQSADVDASNGVVHVIDAVLLPAAS